MSPAAPSPDSLPVVIDRCPLCHGSERRELVRFPAMQWMRCACGLIYKHEQPATTTEALYAEDYFTSAGYGLRRHLRRIMVTAPDPRRWPIRRLGRCSISAARWAMHSKRRPRSTCLRPAQTVSGYAVEQCQLGFRAERGTLDALPFNDAEFAIVTMKHVLEHTPDPRRALAEVHRVLHDSALLIAIPDARYHKAQRNPATSGFYLPERGGTEHFVCYEHAR
ncbi:MAG: methyltransferase domain-containing protein [Steroidobacteraceae bacterium]